MAREVVVLSGVRTAIGTYGGALKDVPATTLGATVIREAVARAKIEAGEVGHVVGHRGGAAGCDAVSDREPSMRQRIAGDRFGRAAHHAG